VIRSQCRQLSQEVRDRRYRYLRNYMPHLIYGQHVEYMWQMPSVGAWESAWRDGKLNAVQRAFWEEKPAEELYDLRADPFEVKNLAQDAAHGDVLARMRTALDRHMLEIRDNGFIPEGSPLEGYAESRNKEAYPLERIMQAAGAVIRRDPANLAQIRKWLGDPNECVRYWAAQGCVMLREKAAPAAAELRGRLGDPSGSVRVAAAEALCRAGSAQEALPVLRGLLAADPGPRVRLQAANALQNLGAPARPALPEFEKALNDPDVEVPRAARYFVSLYR
jgi:hypothetical protein